MIPTGLPDKRPQRRRIKWSVSQVWSAAHLSPALEQQLQSRVEELCSNQASSPDTHTRADGSHPRVPPRVHT